jgi:hypothetical protein
MPALARVLHLSLWRSLRPPPPPPPSGLRLSAVRAALVRAEELIRPAPPAPALPPVLPPNVILLRPVAPPVPIELEDIESPWDPEPATGIVLRDLTPDNDDDEEPLVRDEALILQEINGSKTLLLEIVRRASYDWVLYRTSRRLAYKIMADQAYAWLFLERPGTKDWNTREREGKFITSFEAICEALDLDPDTVRNHVKKLTPRNVMSVGRPAEYRRRDVFSGSQGEDDAHSLPSGMIVESNPSDEDTIY